VKKNLFKIASFSAALLFISNFAYAILPPQPKECPKVSAIQAIGVSRTVVQGNNGVWFAGRRNQPYHTPYRWTFIIGNIEASDANSAYLKAANGLSTLAFQLGPFSSQEHWLCYYNTLEGYAALAIMPTVAAGLSTTNQFFS
jgi:hypothetical protein